MSIYCLSDPHLSFGTPNKKMDIFGPNWQDHAKKIANSWQNRITSSDVVLLPGDISWAKNLDQALPDLKWLHQLPGKKVLLQGNHEHWWGTASSVRKVLPPSLHILDNDFLQLGNVLFVGMRLWDTSEYHCHDIIDWSTPDGKAPEMYNASLNDATNKIYDKDLMRLEKLVDQILNLPNRKELTIIGLNHYPPTSPELMSTRATQIWEKLPELKHVVFGHLHTLKKSDKPYFGIKNQIEYHLCSSDYLNFKPKLILK